MTKFPLILLAFLALLVPHTFTVTGSSEISQPVLEIPKKEQVQVEEAVVTAYTLSPDENDSSPCIGAWNDNLCELQNHIQICATRKYPRGTNLKVGDMECTVLDKTSSKFAQRIDILMASKEEAYQFGKRTLGVEVK